MLHIVSIIYLVQTYFDYTYYANDALLRIRNHNFARKTTIHLTEYIRTIQPNDTNGTLYTRHR